jgi:hypothetical protein
MASTPLYKRLKTNGTSFYAFPGAAEDISAAYQNANYNNNHNNINNRHNNNINNM